VILLVTACAGRDDAEQANAATTVPPTTTTAPPAAIPGVPPSATGATGGGRDERIGPPGDGQPAFEVLVAGECFNEVVDEAANATHRMVQVSCDGPHDAEAFARFDLPAGPEVGFPGEQEVRRMAYQGCLDQFEPYVGSDYAVSELRIAALRPVASTWPAGDRAVLCSLYDGDLEPLVGTLWNSGR
jgi:hypothetical protein